MRARLYSLIVSNAGFTARLMLERKGIEAKVVDLLPGIHPLQLWMLGYRRGTVPALKLDGRRIEGSMEIARALEELVPEPPLFPLDPERRRAVEAAEAWGDAELQNVPRRIFRHAAATDNALRARLARELGLPLPRLVGALNQPVARALAARVDADEAHVRTALADLGATLDRVDALIADGTIGGSEPNVADFQIAPSIRLLSAFADLEPLLRERPCDAHARRFLPDFPAVEPFLTPPLRAVAGL